MPLAWSSVLLRRKLRDFGGEPGLSFRQSEDFALDRFELAVDRVELLLERFAVRTRFGAQGLPVGLRFGAQGP